MPLSMDGQPRREALVAQRVCFETIGLPQRRRRLEAMADARREGKRQIIELRNRGFCGAREASSSLCDRFDRSSGSRAAGSRRVISVVTGKVAEHWPSRPIGASLQV